MTLAPLSTVLCARQPIFDSKLEIYGYELLYRDENGQGLISTDEGDNATSELILNAFTELPIKNLLDGKKGFVNFTRELLRSPPPLGENNIVIEVLENIVFDEDVVEDLQTLKKMGYLIALDDYEYQEGDQQVLALTDIIKVDMLSRDIVSIEHDLEIFRNYSPILLAEKIETKRDFIECKRLGFDLFQGYFLSKPTLVSGRKITSDQQAVLHLVGVLQNKSSEFTDIESVISSSASLTFKLLRLLNSSAFSFVSNIDSVQRAIAILGLEKIRSWGTMLALSNVEDKPRILSTNALIRAHMCQSIGDVLSQNEHRDALFTMGLLSTLDSFLEIPLSTIAKAINLSSPLERALLEREGSMGFILDTAINFETAKFDRIDFSEFERLGVCIQDLQKAYQNSIIAAAEIMKCIN